MREIYSTNGLGFSGKYPFFICNPVTGEKMEFPYHPPYIDREDSKCWFGFAPLSKVFKVVRFVYVMLQVFSIGIYAEVYNCATRKWSVIPNVPFFNNTKENVLVNGVLHWMGLTNNLDANVSFNLDSEEFQEVPLPSGFLLDISKFKLYLVILGECLCIVHTVEAEHIEIWVMKEYGVESAWVKEYIIQDIDLEGVILGPYKPIKLMDNGDILLLCSGKTLGYYDPKEKTFTCINFDAHLFWDPYLEPVLHMGSLISPKICGNQGKVIEWCA